MGTSLQIVTEKRTLAILDRHEYSKMENSEICGTYERVSVENYEDFLKELDVTWLLRKAATASTPVMTVSEADGTWTFKTSTMVKSMELKFKIGEEFEETTPDGREVKAIVTRPGNNFISVQTAKKEGEKSTKVTREFTATGCNQVMEVVGTAVVCTQVFNKK